MSERTTAGQPDFRALFESAPGLYLVLDPGLKIVAASDAYLRATVTRREEVLGRDVFDVFPANADDPNATGVRDLRASLERVLRDRAPDPMAVRKYVIRRPPSEGGGFEERFWSPVNSPVLGPDGEVAWVIHRVEDVTERKRAEEDLASHTREADRRRRLYEAALSNTPDLVYVFDLEHRFAYANEGLLAMWGKTREEAIGKNCLELGYEPWHAAMHDREIEQVVATKKPIKGEVPFTGTYGRRIYEYIFVPVRGENGEVEAVAGTTRDVTDRRQAEELLRQGEQRFRALMEQAPFAIQVFSPDGRVVRVNRAWEELWGVTLDRIPDYNILQNAQLKSKGVLPYIERAFAGEPVRVPAIQYEPSESARDPARRGDPPRWVAAVAYPLKDEAGQVREVVILFEDISARKQAEQALHEASATLRSFYDTSPVMMGVVDLIGDDILHLTDNAATGRFFGVEPESLAGRRASELGVPQEPLREWVRHYRESERSGKAVRFEYAHEAPGGPRWVSAIVYCIERMADGRSRFSYVAEDVTERKRVEDALRGAERQWRDLAEALPNLVWTDLPDGQCDYLSSQWRVYTGIPEEELLGLNWLERVIHPDDRQRTLDCWMTAVADKGVYDLEYRIRRHDGEYHWFKTRGVPIRDGQGRIVKWFGTCTDIEDQKRAGETARFLADVSTTLAAVVDYESTLQKVAGIAVPYFADWSAVDVAAEGGSLRRLAAVHQDPEKLRLAQELVTRYPPRANARSGIGHVFRTGQPEIRSDITEDMLVKGAKDEDHLGLLRGLGLRSHICVPLTASGRTLGVLTFATAESGRNYTRADLSVAEDLARRAAVAIENARLYKELREADRRKDEFLATLAHELRNPLAPIRNSLQILKMPHLDVPTAERTREMMERQVHHLVRLVDDLLDVSRVMRGKVELRREQVELAPVVARAVETTQPLIESQRHDLRIRLPDESLALDADPVRLAQVVGNLLANAAKYTEPNGRIWLTARREGNAVVLSVRDAGIGIAPDMLTKVFDLFVQADQAADRSQGGLGIGLTLVRSLVEMHGGTVEARSPGLGSGSEFVVRLPLASVQPADPGPRGKDAHPGQATPPSGHRLLVVDDNQDAANSLALLLSLQGHEVRVAHDGRAALELLNGYRPEVIFLDIGMPGMDGYEVARRVRRQRGLEAVRLAALTGWGQQEDRRRSAEAGFDHHLVKPVDPNALEEVLSRLKTASG